MKVLRTIKIGDYEYDLKEILLDDKEYPEKIHNIKNPPKKLYVLGNLPDPDKKSVSVVGARVCSDYGIALSKAVASDLSKKDVQVISGLAIGIDANAHIGAINQEKPTFAIVATGVDICYPSYNFNIYEKILEYGGGIISEYEPSTPPLPSNFPQRNRLISALSDAVCVVEARRRSGSLTTVDYALEQGKAVFACAGRVGDSLAEGTNYLIKQGAYILTETSDLTNYLQIDKPLTYENLASLDYNEHIIFEVLQNDNIHFDEILTKTKLPSEIVKNTLMSLELKGYIEEGLPNYYKKSDVAFENAASIKEQYEKQFSKENEEKNSKRIKEKSR